MTAEYYSSLALVSSAAVYTLAMLVHSAEWAAARTPAAAPVPTRASVRTLAGAGGPDLPEQDRSEHDRPGQDRPGRHLVDEDLLVDHLPGDNLRGRDLGGANLAAVGEAAMRDVRVDAWGRVGLALTMVGFAANLAGVVLRGMAAGRAPWGNMLEFLSSAMVVVVATYLVLAWRTGARWLGLPVTALAALANGLAVTVFYVAVAPLVPALHSVWFLIHILAATISAAAFNVGALTALLYLLKTRAERRGAVSGYLARLPDVRTLDRLSYRCLALGFPLWTFTVAAGAIWAQYAWGRYWGWDPKETWALVTWVVFACYLHARSTAGWKGRRAAGLALLGVATFWFNFVGINLLVSGLHSYAGV